MVVKMNVGKRNSSDLYVAFDIGSSRIRLAAGYVDDDLQVEVIYYNECKSQGVQKATISNLSLLSKRLTLLSQDFLEKTGFDISHCILGISGKHIESKNEQNYTLVSGNRVSLKDVKGLLTSISHVKTQEGYHLIHTEPQVFLVDNYEVENPVDLNTTRLEVKVHVIACLSDQEKNLRDAIGKVSSNIKVDAIAYNGLVASDLVLTEAEKEIGVIFLDIGAGAINVALYDRKKLVQTFALGIAGNDIIHHIATTYGIPFVDAESILVNHARASYDILTPEELNNSLRLKANFAQDVENEVIIPYDDLTKRIELCLKTIFNRIRDRIDNFYKDNPGANLSLGAGAVVSGGLANLKGLDYILRKELAPYNVPINKWRKGYARGVNVNSNAIVRTIDNKDNALAQPDKVVVLGLLRYAKKYKNSFMSQAEEISTSNGVKGTIDKLVNWFKHEF